MAAVRFAMGGEDPVPDGRLDHEVDEIWVELAATLGGDRVGRVTGAASVAVSAAVGDGVERVGDRHDAGGERNLRSAQATGVARTVPSFVVG
jgi:hypothetical protein